MSCGAKPAATAVACTTNCAREGMLWFLGGCDWDL